MDKFGDFALKDCPPYAVCALALTLSLIFLVLISILCHTLSQFIVFSKIDSSSTITLRTGFEPIFLNQYRPFVKSAMIHRSRIGTFTSKMGTVRVLAYPAIVSLVRLPASGDLAHVVDADDADSD